MAHDDRHQHLARRVPRGVRAALRCAVKIVYAVDYMFIFPIPAWRAPNICVVAEESGGDVHRLSQPNHSLIVIANADLRLWERPIPLLNLPLCEYVFIGRARAVRVVCVKTDRLQINHVADKNDSVASPFSVQILAELKITWVMGRTMNVTDYENTRH
jgi:hypothetical protein